MTVCVSSNIHLIPVVYGSPDIFNDGFEGADAQWTIWGSPDLNNTDWAYAGSESCKIDAVEGAYNDTGTTYGILFVQARVRFSALPDVGQYIDVIGPGATTGYTYPVMAQVWHNGTHPIWRVRDYIGGGQGLSLIHI